MSYLNYECNNWAGHEKKGCRENYDGWFVGCRVGNSWRNLSEDTYLCPAPKAAWEHKIISS
jgi:hypothetical protein